MLNREDLPDTDLNRLQAEILSGPFEAALPVNMTDEWLNLIARDIYEALSDDELTWGSPGVQRAEAPLRLIYRLLVERKGKTLHIDDWDSLRGHYMNYLAEVALELVRRQKGQWIPPATVDTILTRTDLTLEQALYGVANVRCE
ncbi:hypothetical protein GCM10007933_15850 [Zoogloea oryzae]|uniref:Uncharacterized protein n=1 Tax=Zoogloea oryzae TaxID=310767 RepID=A0ABQ6FA70_9RHOO|nr:hypothetical protein [Zoogloea oryzae]GLT22127.1 hypothetical protein GCM10007933_15850 [Zoogloea oryzae]